MSQIAKNWIGVGVVAGLAILYLWTFAWGATPNQPPIQVGTQAVSTGAIQMSSALGDVSWIIVQNDPDSAVDMFVGTSASQPIQLQAGQSATFDNIDASSIYIKGNAGVATANFTWRKR